MKSQTVIKFFEPTTRSQLLDALSLVHRRATEFWDSLSIEYFFAPYHEKWSPAENVLHLNKSTRPVVLAMRLPLMIPRLLFGIQSGSSRSYDQIRSMYQEVLTRGGQAGSYAPKRQGYPSDPPSVRDKIMQDWNLIWQRLIQVTHRWDDRSLDRIRLPHPLLGKMTVREMLYFTLYHHQHHLEIVFERTE
jgi:hypothetical protein